MYIYKLHEINHSISCFLFFSKRLEIMNEKEKKTTLFFTNPFSFSFPMKNGLFLFRMPMIVLMFRNFVFEVCKVGYFCSRQMQGESTTRMCLKERDIIFFKFPIMPFSFCWICTIVFYWIWEIETIRTWYKLLILLLNYWQF